MALAAAFLNLLLVAFFCVAFSCVGNLLLRALRFKLSTPIEHRLVAVALGIILTEILLFFVQFSQHLRSGSFVVAGVLLTALLVDFPHATRCARDIFPSLKPSSPPEKVLQMAILVAVLAEFLISCAPLTGSDAQDYHFNAQRLYLLHGFHPLFSNVHTFLCGQHHSLILFGLALGSERLSLGFIFLAGILTAASLACLASRWASRLWSAAVALVFLLTPIVFWQISTSGSPDVFMAFFLSVALLTLGAASNPMNWRRALVIGVLTGAVGGAKYTGLLIALPVLLCFVAEFRNFSTTAVFGLGSLLGGVWTYLRNFLWFGNPVFPFLASRISPGLVTTFALKDLASATGQTDHQALYNLFPFLLFSATHDRSAPGLYEFFGPTVLLLFPLILLAFQNTRAWRTSLLVWFLAGSLIFFASGLPRFMLPLFPIALIGVAAGIETIQSRRWRYAYFAAVTLFSFLFLSGFAGLALYGAKPIQAALGAISRDDYLQQTAQDYPFVSSINRLLADDPQRGTALLFLRHTYYLQVPYLNGDPANSFEIDPPTMSSPDSWRDYFRSRNISYVIRGADYPLSIAAPLHQLEQSGDLIPFAQIETRNLTGMRIEQSASTARLIFLQVKR